MMRLKALSTLVDLTNDCFSLGVPALYSQRRPRLDPSRCAPDDPGSLNRCSECSLDPAKPGLLKQD